MIGKDVTLCHSQGRRRSFFARRV